MVVQNGAVFEVKRNGQPAGEVVPTGYFTVAGLFEAVEQFAYSDGITVTYDPDFGFPEYRRVDRHRAPLHDPKTFGLE